MAMEIGDRPPSLNGCWASWNEVDVENTIKTEMDSGALHTRRRFTAVSRIVQASVKLPKEVYNDFMTWYRVNQRMGSIATLVINPLGEEEVFQWTEPPQISWIDPKVFQASVTMYQGSWFNATR